MIDTFFYNKLAKEWLRKVFEQFWVGHIQFFWYLLCLFASKITVTWLLTHKSELSFCFGLGIMYMYVWASRGPTWPDLAYEISTFPWFQISLEWFSDFTCDFRISSGFQDFTRDFMISSVISGFHLRFQDFTCDFRISPAISGFHLRFGDFARDFGSWSRLSRQKVRRDSPNFSLYELFLHGSVNPSVNPGSPGHFLQSPPILTSLSTLFTTFLYLKHQREPSSIVLSLHYL